MFSPDPIHLTQAALIAGGVAVAAGLLRLLTFSGALAAFAVGVFIFGFGRLTFAAPLLAFFFSSSLLSLLGKARKAGANARYSKSSTRDAGQVLANGGVATALVILFALLLQQHRVAALRPLYLLYLASLGAVNADTWATEVGGLSASRPWLVTTLRRVDRGTSGAVSVAGLLAALAGAAFIALVGWAVWPRGSTELLWRIDPPEIIAVAWGGFVAAYVDSLLGATVQAHYRCGHCGQITERPVHCEAPATLARGWRWVNNDVVNLATSLCGVLFTWILLKLFAYPR